MRNLLIFLTKTFLLITISCSVCYAEYGDKFTDKGWQTINTFLSPGGGPTSIGVDDQGVIYETGTRSLHLPKSYYSFWTTRKSTDKGLTWTIIDNYSSGLNRVTYPAGFASDHQGNLFVAGQAMLDSEDWSQWIIRKSEDGGKTWTIVDKNPPYSIPLSVTVDFNNNIYAAGYMGSKDEVHGVVRKSSDAGKTWNTIFLDNSEGSSRCTSVDVDRHGNVYVAYETNATWIVKKNINFGADPKSWVSVDRYNYFGPADSSMRVQALKIAKNGDIYVVGTAARFTGGKGPLRWLVRKSSDEGKTWRTVDDFVSAPLSTNIPLNIWIDDTTGYIYVAGHTRDEDLGLANGILRVSMDNGLTWSIQDSIPKSHIIGFTSSKLNELYTISNPMDGVSQWVTRKYL